MPTVPFAIQSLYWELFKNMTLAPGKTTLERIVGGSVVKYWTCIDEFTIHSSSSRNISFINPMW
ncbi:6918_t:CDS:2 [Gigaspora margarita]|uniref:6918_t:CDS:1 n=1 Tax=Gigaspora margarita TaxID=4874 RepID=A0ABN7V9M4_GIGMA|nr:6918_t:CDS:2 [Gigaspora margarita]